MIKHKIGVSLITVKSSWELLTIKSLIFLCIFRIQRKNKIQMHYRDLKIRRNTAT